MERRAMMALPGLAVFAATRTFAAAPGDVRPDGTAPHISRKALAKRAGSKASYKVPKSAAKQTKYVNTLSALLTLTSTQQQQVAATYAEAASSVASIRATLKSLRKTLNTAVLSSDSSTIARISAEMGTLKAQKISIGATANAAVYAFLGQNQQARLSQVVG